MVIDGVLLARLLSLYSAQTHSNARISKSSLDYIFAYSVLFAASWFEFGGWGGEEKKRKGKERKGKGREETYRRIHTSSQ